MPHLQTPMLARGSGPSKGSPMIDAPISAVFHIRPDGPGWCLQGEDLQPLIFGSGAAAERQGRFLAQRLAELGCDVRVNVYDLRDLLVGTIKFFAFEGRSELDIPRNCPTAH